MTQHRWYHPYKRRYGPKPNTRTARGLPRRRKKAIVSSIKHFDYLPKVEVDTNVEPVAIPTSMAVMKRYIKMYNWYVNKYQLYRDKELCMEMVRLKFGLKTTNPIKRAINVCKYILVLDKLEHEQTPETS
jgi:hypothetical protein